MAQYSTPTPITLPMQLSDTATPPTRAHDDDAGIDLITPEDLTIIAGGTIICDTGVSVAIPTGHVGLLAVRSSIGAKRKIRLANSIGVIDAGYRGTIRAVLHNFGTKTQTISRGERVVQLIIVPIPTIHIDIVDHLPASERNTGGFGSTGTQ